MLKEIDKWKTIEKKLSSSDRSHRIAGWALARDHFVDFQHPVNPLQRAKLLSFLQDEADDDVRQFGILVMLGIPFPTMIPAIPSTVASSYGESETLDAWLWNVFRRPSVVLSVSERDFIRRDAPALIDLARRLDFRDYGEAEVRLIRPDEPEWRQQIVENGYQSICFIGRLGLYGKDALNRWSNSHARFGFELHQRPRGLPPGRLHPDYHCIYERIGDVRMEHYRSVDREGIRTDFGLVQRYPVYDGTTTMVVVNCAGESALGTSAAVKWAAVELSKPTHPYNGEPIKAPPGISPDSYMEALIEVEAQNTSHVPRPTHITLRKLYVDRACWNKTERRWEVDPPKKITIVRNHGRTVDILFDGKPTSQLKSAQSFRLLDHMCRNVSERKDNIVDLEKLARTEEIWDTPRPDINRVRRNLSVLKHRYLGDALSFGPPIRMHTIVELS